MSKPRNLYVFVDGSVVNPHGEDCFHCGIGTVAIRNGDFDNPEIKSFRYEISKYTFSQNHGYCNEFVEMDAMAKGLEQTEDAAYARVISDHKNMVDKINNTKLSNVGGNLVDYRDIHAKFEEIRQQLLLQNGKTRLLVDEDCHIDVPQEVIALNMTKAHGASIIASGARSTKNIKGGFLALRNNIVDRTWLPEDQGRIARFKGYRDTETWEPVDAPVEPGGSLTL